MAETVTSRKQEKVYRTDRFKRSVAETEGRKDLSVGNQDNFFERVSVLQYIVVVFGLVTFEVSHSHKLF